ncbi:C2H2-type zinc finger protein [Endozoicomonas gorgoniicola]|uniref:C2H2-type zinc finger protein n=1 Tax=Endozoicomonas gorgoniicola TaxID=1234144 RepID=UPI003898E92E
MKHGVEGLTLILVPYTGVSGMPKTPKAYICDTCGRTLSDSSAFKKHQLTHTGVKPHICGVCEKPFARADSLTRHMRTHTNERPFPCDVCNKAFRNQGALAEHRRIHSGVRPYECEKCDAAFTQLAHLRAHEKIHESTCPHKCKACGCRFRLESNLSSHLVTDHSYASTSQFVTAHTHLEPVGIVSVTTQTTVTSGSTISISTVTSRKGGAYTVTKETSSATITTATQESGLVTTEITPNVPGSDSRNIFEEIIPDSELALYDYESDDSLSNIT